MNGNYITRAGVSEGRQPARQYRHSMNPRGGISALCHEGVCHRWITRPFM